MEHEYDFEHEDVHDLPLPNTCLNSTQSIVAYFLKLLPIILGLIFGNQFIKYKRKIRKLALVTEIKTRLTSPFAKQPFPNDSEPKSFTLYSCEELVVGVGRPAVVNIGVEIEVPAGCYGRISEYLPNLQNSGVIVHGSIDSWVLLYNFGALPFKVSIGSPVATLVLESIVKSCKFVLDYNGSPATTNGSSKSGAGTTGAVLDYGKSGAGAAATLCNQSSKGAEFDGDTATNGSGGVAVLRPYQTRSRGQAEPIGIANGGCAEGVEEEKAHARGSLEQQVGNHPKLL